MKRSQTARTSPGVSGPFQWRGVGKWRSRVAGSSRRSRVVHKTGKSATISTRSKRGSVVFIHPFYPPPPFPKTTPNTSEPAVGMVVCVEIIHPQAEVSREELLEADPGLDAA